MRNEILIATLTAETKSFKAEYIERTTEWASSDFDRIEKVANAPHPQWENFATPGFVKETTPSKPGFRRPFNIDYAQGTSYRKAVDTRYKAGNIVEKGREAYVTKMVALAERHYEDSVIKLAARIEAKGLNLEALTVKTAHVSVNLEITLTDGEKSVRAFTIIASGPVQKPHYRYLIK